MGDDNSNSTDRVMTGIITFIMAFVMVCSAAIPIVSSQINGLTSLVGTTQVPNVLDIAGIQSLLGVGVLLLVIGIVYGVVKKFITSDR